MCPISYSRSSGFIILSDRVSMNLVLKGSFASACEREAEIRLSLYRTRLTLSYILLRGLRIRMWIKPECVRLLLLNLVYTTYCLE